MTTILLVLGVVGLILVLLSVIPGMAVVPHGAHLGAGLIIVAVVLYVLLIIMGSASPAIDP